MKPTRFAAPLLSLVLLFSIFQPSENSELFTKAIPFIANRITPAVNTPAPVIAVSGGLLNENLLAAEFPSANPSTLMARNPEASIIYERKSFSSAFQQFIETLTTETDSTLSGVYAPGVLAMPVVQQPTDNPVFVSSDMGVVTQFNSASQNGVVGLLAHNYLSGKLFYNLDPGQEVRLVYGDGKVRRFQVEESARFQKVDPRSLRSDLIELATGKQMTTAEVYRRFYAGHEKVTFQTCLARKGLSNWGLYFVTASPLVEN